MPSYLNQGPGLDMLRCFDRSVLRPTCVSAAVILVSFNGGSNRESRSQGQLERSAQPNTIGTYGWQLIQVDDTGNATSTYA